MNGMLSQLSKRQILPQIETGIHQDQGNDRNGLTLNSNTKDALIETKFQFNADGNKIAEEKINQRIDSDQDADKEANLNNNDASKSNSISINALVYRIKFGKEGQPSKVLNSNINSNSPRQIKISKSPSPRSSKSSSNHQNQPSILNISPQKSRALGMNILEIIKHKTIKDQNDSIASSVNSRRSSQSNVVDQIQRIDRVRGLQIKYPLFLINSQGKCKLYWDTFLMVIVLWVAIHLPWEIAFPEAGLPTLNFVIFSIFIVDIAVNLNTTFFDENDDEIISRKQCALKYIKSSNFILDVASSLPIDLFTDNNSDSDGGGGNQNSLLSLLKFFQILRLLRLGKLLKHMQSQSFRVVGQLIKSFLIFLLILHWFTLMWYTLIQKTAPDQQLSNNVWLPSNYRILTDSTDLNGDVLAVQFYDKDFSKIEKYIYTFYSMMMAILGGETAPMATEQALIASTITFCGQMTIAFIFAEISHILFQMNEKKNQYENVQSNLLELMNTHNIEEKLQLKVIEYFEFCWRKQVVFDKELSDFSGLTQNLEKECLVSIHQDIIERIDIFSSLEFNEILGIMKCLKAEVFMPNESVFQEEDYVNSMYLCTEGVLQVEKIGENGFNEFLDMQKENGEEPESEPTKNEKEKVYLTNGDYFGQIAILGDWQAEYGIRSVTFSILQVFSKNDFTELKKEFPEIERQIRKQFKPIQQMGQNQEQRLLKQIPFFKNCNEQEVLDIYLDYMQEAYLASNSLVAKPHDEFNAFYYVYSGYISVYYEETLVQTNVKEERWSASRGFVCIDDTMDSISDFTNDYLPSHIKRNCKKVANIMPGQWLGCMSFQKGGDHQKNDYYFLCQNQCSLGVLTGTIMETLRQNKPELFDKITTNAKEIRSVIDTRAFLSDWQPQQNSNESGETATVFNQYEQMKLQEKLNELQTVFENQIRQINKIQKSIQFNQVE